MPCAVDLGGLNQIVGQSHIELPQHEDGRGAKEGGQNDGPQVVVQANGLKQHKAGDDGQLAGHHHGGQEQHEYDLLALKIDLGKGIGRQGGDEHLPDDAEQRNIEGVGKGAQHGGLFVHPYGGVVLPLDPGRQPVEGPGKYLRRGFERGEHHPYQRNDKQHGDERNNDGAHDGGRSFILFHGAFSFL